MSRIGVLHPGEMGVSLAASARDGGNPVYWLSGGRSQATRQRADAQGLIEIKELSEFCQICEVIVSICPPHAAEEVAELVIEGGFQGEYLDANAISPRRAKRLGDLMEGQHIQFTDGSIIGGPAWKAGETCLYLSGKHAEAIASLFRHGVLDWRIIGEEVGKASALKMCYAAYTKGTSALLVSILAAAEALGVREELYRQWDQDEPDFSEHAGRRAVRATAKAWRFAGEMREISSTFEEAGLPGGFHSAAAEVFERVAVLKGRNSTTVEEIVSMINGRIG